MAYKMMHNGWTVMALRLDRYGVTVLITVQDRDGPLWGQNWRKPWGPKVAESVTFSDGSILHAP